MSNLSDIVSDEGLSQESKLDCIEDRTAPIRYVAYGLVGITIVLSFIVSPFVYFWFEEEDTSGFELPRRGAKICSAVKYVLTSIGVLGALSIVALTVQVRQLR